MRGNKQRGSSLGGICNVRSHLLPFRQSFGRARPGPLEGERHALRFAVMPAPVRAPEHLYRIRSAVSVREHHGFSLYGPRHHALLDGC